MMRKALFLIMLGSFSQYLFAQDYNVDNIPESLKDGANAVIRLWDSRFEIENEEKSVYRVKKAITILKEEGKGWGEFIEQYDKLDKIRAVKITLYDAKGEVVKKVRGFEIEDINYTSSGSLYDSNKLKVYIPDEVELPYTVEIEFDKTKTSSLHYPIWNMRRGPKLAVEKATLSVHTPDGYGFRYKEVNYDKEVKITYDDGVDYEWSVENLTAMEGEYRGLSVGDMSPHVFLAPTKFSMEGYSGSMDTWQSFGLWIKQLNQGRDKLPIELELKLKDMVAGVTDDKEKIRIVYNYLQANTRYVSIQLGIGGYQPFEAIDVANNGYGDCKALTYFTHSMLKSIGINSNYTLVLAGQDEDDIQIDFPSSQFNHVILSVPMAKDTVWLECTSQDAPFNFLGGFTSDRHVLMITDDGGKLVKTPSYPIEQNTQTRLATVTLDDTGNGRAVVETFYRGTQYDNYYWVIKEGKEDQRKHLLNSIDIPAFDLGDFSFSENRASNNPTLSQNLTVDLRNYATITGDRLFFSPNLMNKLEFVPPKAKDRKSPIDVKNSFMDTDTIRFIIPERFRLEFPAEPSAFESDFGSYSIDYKFDELKNELTYIRNVKIYKGRFSAKRYDEYRDFRKSISRADKAKLVLIGST
ncbi:MAG: hypothetical protein ACJAS3_000567 [Roseivirga sp.]|jgi:hypothetical protein